MAKRKPMRKPKDNGRPRRKKVSVLNSDDIEYVDYKDINLLRKFMSERAKIRARRVNGNNPRQQRELARAVKNAREMALLPYTSRVVQQRRSDRGGSRGGGRGGPREGGDERPLPKSPPPPPGRAPEGAADEGSNGSDAPAPAEEVQS
jgi:small subunit ribosomal protein S18